MYYLGLLGLFLFTVYSLTFCEKRWGLKGLFACGLVCTNLITAYYFLTRPC